MDVTFKNELDKQKLPDDFDCKIQDTIYPALFFRKTALYFVKTKNNYR